MDRNRRMLGVAIATPASALFLAGAAAVADEPDTVKVRCYGANECKGQSDCKTSMSDKGKNSCKGKGFKMMTEKACLEHFGRA